MKTGRARDILRRLRQAVPECGLTDGQLLGRYAAGRDDAAFEALVRRHGPVIYGVCRRVLHHAQDAEDAFQATFLILARKAAAVANRPAVGGWLYTVAYHTCLAARASGVRRKARERQVEEMPQPVALPEDDRRELLELMDRELARLPEKYRLPVVLCELQGRSRREAARELGLPEGTLSSRLATARKMLAGRLSRGGAVVTAVALTGLLAGGARAARVPGGLVVSTVRAAGGAVTAGVAALAQGVLKAMLLTKLKGGLWAILIVAAVGAAAAGLNYRSAAAGPARPADPPAARPAAPNDLDALRAEVEALKERVKALENQAHVPVGKAGPDNPAAAPPEGSLRWAFTDPAPKAPPAVARVATLEYDAPADLEAAIQKLRQHPDDKAALGVLDQAIQRLREDSKRLQEESKQKWEESKQKGNEAWRLEEFEHAVQRLRDPLAPPAEESPKVGM